LTPSLVPREAINTVWVKVLPHIRKLISEISGGRVTEMSLYRDVLNGHLQFWIVMDEDSPEQEIVAFVMTRVPNYEKVTLVSIDFLSGERLMEWMSPMYELIEKWAKEVVGAEGIEVCGRPGWERAFATIGHDFKRKFTIIEKRF
jgi:hypothetical protein